MFTLGICTWKYSNQIESGYALVPTSNQPNIQEYFLQIARRFKDFDLSINDQRLHGCLKERLHRIQKQQLRLISKYLNEIENSTAKNQINFALHETTNDLIENLDELKRKIRLINDLQRDHFEYYNVFDPLDRKMNEQTLENLLINKYSYSRILCSTDRLNEKNPSKFHQLRRELSRENIRLIYADFSDCSFQLSEMKILSSSPLLPTPSDEDNVINILLLGETGVGKSTFINAFVNYLTFDTFQQAEINQPIALIPVSFLLTTGEDFDEHLIQFGEVNQSTNEDFRYSGQSVTQQCKSHCFDLQRDICIIDTPGFGDTRGLEQDDLNLKHILQYLNKLTHLNAICILLQPNVTRLNSFYRTCLSQILDRFGWDLSENILFGFTNSRSTGYTPGDTTPLLRRMLESLPMKNIPFTRENCFCFDSEAFRYLIALQNGIQFDQVEKNDYEISWKTSVVESNRLVNYVRTQLNAYALHPDEQTEKYAQIQIVQMIRPMLETMRNLLRNLLLIQIKSSNTFIQLNPRSLSRQTAFCTLCKRDPFFLGQFWFLPDDPHQIEHQCRTCQCHIDQHMTIDYILSYEISKDRSLFNPDEMNQILNQLCFTSVEFAYFLIDGIHSTDDDPFLLGLLHLMEEEKVICMEVEERKELNQQLYNELKRLIQNYKQQLQKIRGNSKRLDLKNIYQQIQIIQQISMINEQLNMIKGKSETMNPKLQ